MSAHVCFVQEDESRLQDNLMHFLTSFRSGCTSPCNFFPAKPCKTHIIMHVLILWKSSIRVLMITLSKLKLPVKKIGSIVKTYTRDFVGLFWCRNSRVCEPQSCCSQPKHSNCDQMASMKDKTCLHWHHTGNTGLLHLKHTIALLNSDQITNTLR